MHRIEYEASGGKEVFLSIDQTLGSEEAGGRISGGGTPGLIGYVRLRLPASYDDACITPEDRPESFAFIRELKVFGQIVPINESAEGRWQHMGYGGQLLSEAERIAKEEWKVSHMLVTSGVGVREYYRKKGYSRLGPYMAKEL